MAVEAPPAEKKNVDTAKSGRRCSRATQGCWAELKRSPGSCHPAAWTYADAALGGIARALALQQGYMLAQIAEEIHAPDCAAQDTGEGGNSDYQDLGLLQ